MKYLKYITLLLVSVFILSCEMSDNVNPKEAQVVPASALFTNAQVATCNQIDNISQNLNISRMLAQYIAQTTYYGESTWNFYDRSLPDRMWREFYRNSLIDFKEARKLTAEDNSLSDKAKEARYAQIDVMEVLIYQNLVDINGNVPYTEALGGSENPSPAYDDAFTIYKDLISRLSADVNVFKQGVKGFSTSDVLYSGNMESWLKFANSLKLRMAMRLADVDEAMSKTVAKEALEAGVFTSQSESAMLEYFGITPHIGTIYREMVEAGRSDFVAANTIVDVMNNLNDPRRPFYFSQKGGTYVGGKYGYRNSYGSCSSFPESMRDSKYPANILDYVEVRFMIAEASGRGYDFVGANTESLYNEAVTESVVAWGGSESDAASYLAQDDVKYDSNQFRQKVGLQKWIALYNRGLEGWSAWRTFDTPQFNVAKGKERSDIPVRMPYPYREDNVNKQNYDAAAAAIGGDKATTPLFWDIYDTDGNRR